MLTGVVEGSIDEAALAKIADSIAVPITFIHVKRGRTKIEKRIAGYRQAAKLSPWIVMFDLDSDPCPIELARQFVPLGDPLHLRIVVREIEAWLFGDRE